MHRKKDGTIFLVEISGVFVTVQGRELVISAIRDVSQRIAGGLALAASEEKFATAFQRAPVLMTVTNLDDGTLLEVNDKF